MVNFLNYYKAYGTHEVLAIPELSMSNGIHWIKGENGSGKSTLLKSIGGIIPFQGDIQINEYNLKRRPVLARRQVTYSEAEPMFSVFLTASEIVKFVAHVRKVNRKAVDEILNYFGVNEFQNQATGGYSAGMLKKLSLCLAFLGEVPWILLDEPFAFIDKETENKLLELIKLKRINGINFILTSHHELGNDLLEFDGIFSIRNAQLHKIR